MITRINKPIVIFRGDDTSAFNLRSIKIILKGDLDLSNAIAKFSLLDYHKEWTVQEVASGELTMSFTSSDTKAMPLGEQTGTFRLYDMSTGEPRQLTVVNKIPFLVTNRVCELDDESYHADVSVASGEIISIEFNVGVGAVNGKADKVKNAVDGDLAGLDDEGNLTDSEIPASDVLRKSQMDSTPTAGSLNPVTSDGIRQAIAAATPSDYEQVKAQVEANAQDIANIDDVIPSQATENNQLADKDFVNSSIATNTATFRGTYNLVSDLSLTTSATHEQVAAAIKAKLAALSITPENNDYCFVQEPKSDAEPTVIVRIDRYKCTVADGVSSWDYEWSLNNSSFTADQWAAINSGITSALVTKLGALPTANELAAALLAKYQKPSTGIPKSDLSSGVQASLDKADSALQTAPVSSVNGKTGAVTLTASDVGAVPTTGGMMTGPLNLGLAVIDDAFGGDTVFFHTENNLSDRVFIRFPSGSGVRFVSMLQNLAAYYSTSATYALNSLCVYSDKLYRCTTAITTAEAWTAEHWIEATVEDVLAAIRSALDGKAPLASPAFTGTPTAPTPSAGDNSTKVATTAFVKTAVAGISITPLSGKTYDFSTNADVYKAVADIARALGATVTNAPTDPVSTPSND